MDLKKSLKKMVHNSKKNMKELFGTRERERESHQLRFIIYVKKDDVIA